MRKISPLARVPARAAVPEFLAGGGRMGQAMRTHDWASSPLGDPEEWPQSLRTAVSIMLNSGHPMFIAWGPEQISLFNEAYMPMLGNKLPGALGRPLPELWADIWDQLGPAAERALAGESTWHRDQRLMMCRHGYREETYFSYSFSPIRDESGRVGGIFCACTETTPLVLANRRLSAETEHLRRLFEQAPSFIVILRGPDHVFELANAASRKLIGRDDLIGRPVSEVYPRAEEEGLLQLLDNAYRRGEPFVGRQHRLTVRDDATGAQRRRYVDFIYQPIAERGERPTGLLVIGSDVTERVIAEHNLRTLTCTLEEQVETRTRDLRRAEEALRQSQKMEAIGQLTGGIAHDFNNLLMGISGAVSLAERQVGAGRAEQAARFLRLARDTTARAAALTHRLLAFSRRQPLDPKPVPANDLVVSMEELMRRTLGRSIELRLALDADSWHVLCDVSQLESALLNLVINARDAMPEGGRLTLATECVRVAGGSAGLEPLEPGDYVSFTVSDTGSGMSPEVAARAFDPFFTTKPRDKGTGLGLSMLYGFARQSGGLVRIDSEPGRGTSVRLYLPRGEGGVEEAPQAAPTETARCRPAADATVLVVDDESAVREVVVHTLQNLGYRVLEARDGASGLQILESSATVDLLISDIGMPGLDGRDMVRRARTKRPELKVLFITGYAENTGAKVLHGEGIALLNKPFTMEAFAQRVCELIECVCADCEPRTGASPA